jgi:hypothetical protein
MDITQIIIVVSLSLITCVIVACGIGLFSLLRELKTTIIKTNTILDDTKLITNSVAKPVSSFSEFMMGFKSGMKLFDSVFNRKKDKTN